jgi:phage host-nuclease inhibitor protein Gam
MARREKVRTPIAPIATIDQADAALAEIADIDRATDAIAAKLNEDIDGLKAMAAEEIAPLAERKAALGDGLLNFAALNGPLFNGKKSLDRPFGKFGYRKSTSLALLKSVASTWKEVLGRLRQYGFRDAIRTKEEVDKEVMSSWPNERLGVCGVQRVEKDEFFYEVKREELPS